jgi:hypothetical protein
LRDLCETVTLNAGPSILHPAYINLKKFKAPTQRYYRKIKPPNIFINMRTLLITLALGLGLTACETNNYNCSCECKGSCSSPSDTTCVNPDVDSVMIETEEVIEGGQ